MGLLKDVIFEAGVLVDQTELKAKNYYTDSDGIRFVRGMPQKMGGWAKFFATEINGIVRGMKTWLDNADLAHIALGTVCKLFDIDGLVLYNITPIRATAALTNPFTTTLDSTTVGVADTAHGAILGDYVEFDSFSAVGGITIDGNYQIMLIVDNDNYEIEHSSAATSSVSGGGGSGNASYEITCGLESAGAGAGYGVGTYNDSTYGTVRSSSIVIPLRTWSLDLLGENLLAMPRNGNLYKWQLNTGTRAVISANAPTGNTGFFVTEERHVVVLGAGGVKMQVDWGDQDSDTVWTPSDQNSAGSRLLTGGSEILTGLRTRVGNVIFTDASIWLMTHIGGLDIFGFRQLGVGASGIIGPMAAADVMGKVYWMGQDDFYYYDGQIQPMRRSKDIRRHVFDNLDIVQKGKSICGINSLFSEIIFFYPTAGTGEIAAYAKYNWIEGVWDIGTVLLRTSWEDLGVFGNPLATSVDKFIHTQESGQDADGSAMNEFITSGPLRTKDGGRILEVMSIYPDFADTSGNLEMSLLTREYPQGAEETVGPSTFTGSTEKIDDLRAYGRQIRMKVGSSVTGSKWRMGVQQFELAPGGEN